MTSVAILLVLGGSAVASAEDTPAVELSQAQLDLNAKAIELVAAKEYEQAVKLFESSLALGKSNVTYLNLGRTLSKLGRCSDATAAYDAVLTAPRVPVPTAAEVATTLTRYREELSSCGTRLVVKCEPADLQLQLNGGEPFACSGAPLQVDAGTYELVATRSDGASRTQQVDGRPGETVQLMMVVPPAVADEPPVVAVEEKPPPPPQRADMSNLRLAGWVVGLAGVAVFTTATIVDWFVISPKVNDFDPRRDDSERSSIQSTQRVNRVLFPVGAVLGVAGGAMLLWPAPVVQKSAVGVSWRFVF